MINHTVLRNAIHCCAPENMTQEKYIERAHGMLSGMVIMIMYISVREFKESVEYFKIIIGDAPISIKCVPDAWVETFREAGINIVSSNNERG
jgi:hypothetical protein